MRLRTLVFRYSAFALIATVANLATQRAVLQFGQSALFFTAAVGAGTIVGLVIKYLLDKRWIFYDTASGLRNRSLQFSLYTAMGVLTTIVFWATETVFWLVWKTNLMRELGAIIGLSIGYFAKYHLDRRFVFTDQEHIDAA
ncbi:MAG: GtrA family protein [Hyphomonadaceae bacterium]|nr:GtrA family protein [Hyphomonadaceae bacterium]